MNINKKATEFLAMLAFVVIASNVVVNFLQPYLIAIIFMTLLFTALGFIARVIWARFHWW